MNEPIWITGEIMLAIQSSLISRFGGLSGMRDEALLESALARPQQLFHNENPTIAEMAAAYAHGIVKNHPFLAGNKRCGFMAAYTFLAANGLQLTAPEEQAVLHALALAAGEIDATQYAHWLSISSIPSSS